MDVRLHSTVGGIIDSLLPYDTSFLVEEGESTEARNERYVSYAFSEFEVCCDEMGAGCTSVDEQHVSTLVATVEGYTVLGMFALALCFLRVLLVSWRCLTPQYSPEKVLCMGEISTCLFGIGQYRDAIRCGMSALRMSALLFGPKDDIVGRMHINLGNCFSEEQKYACAVGHYAMGLELCEPVCGKESIEMVLARAHMSLAAERLN